MRERIQGQSNHLFNGIQQQEQIESARQFLAERLVGAPLVGLILGSGLGYLVDEISDSISIPYSSIPGFTSPSVNGHEGQLVSGTFEGTKVVALKGRSHYYEGCDMWQLTFPVRVLAALGIRILITTNAAGGLNYDFKPGDLMVIEDHINFPGLGGNNPLVGIGDFPGRSRFVNMTNAYDPRLIDMALHSSIAGCSLHKGVYVMVSGPNYETAAEIRFLKTIGGDAVGMSTVPEVIVARHCGLAVLAVSCISNVVFTDDSGTSHEQVLAGVEIARPGFGELLRQVLKKIGGLDICSSP